MRNLWKNSALLTWETSSPFFKKKCRLIFPTRSLLTDNLPACFWAKHIWLFSSHFSYIWAHRHLCHFYEFWTNRKTKQKIGDNKQEVFSWFLLFVLFTPMWTPHRFACRYNNNVFSAAATPLLHLVSYILSRSTKQVKEAPKELVLEETLASVTLWVEPTLIIKGTHFFVDKQWNLSFSASAGRSFNMMEALKNWNILRRISLTVEMVEC